ncbi:MAG TPA: hypothetical protein VMB47_15275 [Candidatus Aquilonibacter sp.]|nr:hypothetical protein [Candidatus Aquilonibacter sp.]
MPPYAPDFYVPENIIGYTGVLQKNPTVYFMSQTHYGHITQVHDDWQNVGREAIYPLGRYAFANMVVSMGSEKKVCLVEQDAARNMGHTSRSAMILIRSGQAVPPELTHAIMVHEEKKARELTSQGLVILPEAANIAREKYPGQAPTDAERNSVGDAQLFLWTPSRKDVPSGYRLSDLKT